MEYEVGQIRTDRGLFLDKGNYGVDPRHPDFAGGARGDGTFDDRRAIADADTFALTLGAPLKFGLGTYRVASNITISSPLSVSVGAIIKPASGVTITLNGAIDAPARQWLDLSLGGGVVISNTGNVYPEWIGATGDGTTNDATAIQAAIDAIPAGGTVTLTRRATSYNLGTTGITISKHGVRLRMNGASLKYSGTGYAIAGVAVSGSYPQDCLIERGDVFVYAANGGGVDCKFSHGTFDRLNVFLHANNTTAWRLLADENGSGPYYNEFRGCNIQGAGSSSNSTTQSAWIFDYAPISGRSPNGNKWFGGRIGQVNRAATIMGDGNVMRGITLEGFPAGSTAIVINHPTSALHCNDNAVEIDYFESGDVIYNIGSNAKRARITLGYLTGVSLTTNVDSGADTMVIFPGEVQKWPIKLGVSGGVILSEILGFKLFGYSASPEGAITAEPGSMCMSANGNIYRKGSGTGNTGWVAM